MNANHKRRIATLELAAGCLQEAVERLHRLCPKLTNSDYATECTETANNISAQANVIWKEVSLLRAEAQDD
jgi:hypothetical protein